MDPLSLTANLITVLQLANSILAVCYEFRAAVQKAPWSLTRVLDEIKDLRNLLENVERSVELLEEGSLEDSKRLNTFAILCEPESGPLIRCQQELALLEKKIVSAYGSGKSLSKIRTFVQVMGWQLKDSEAKTSLERIDRCKNTIVLAMTADEAVMLKEIRDMNRSLNQNVQSLGADISELVSDIKSREHNEEDKAITQWLAPVDCFDNHEGVTNAHHTGTGTWFLQTKAFERWRTDENAFMWLSGFSGCGKTFLFSNVIMSLTSDSFINTDPENRRLASYFYCDFRDKDTQNATNVLGSLVAQLCSQMRSCPTELQTAFKGSLQTSGTRKSPSFPVLREALQSISRLEKVVLLIDAVDECEGRQDLLDFVADLQYSTRRISVLVTSRDEVDIKNTLASFERVQVEHYVEDVDRDIRSYIECRLRSETRLRKLQASVKSDIQQSLNSKSAGMFRLVQCTIDEIATLRTIRSIHDSLKNVPQGLSEIYESILTKVSEPDAPIVRKILLWLSFTVLPLTLEELQSAIAIEENATELDTDLCLANTEDILEMCGSLINVSGEGYVELAHLSVKDYLLSKDIRTGPASNFALCHAMGKSELAVDCFTYLSFRDFQTGPSDSADSFAHRLATHPFLRHASTAWTYYLRGSSAEAQLNERITTFFSTENRAAFLSWVQVLNADAPFKWSLYPRHATPLYYAASFGLLHIVQHIIKQGVALNAPGSRFGGTALHGAIYRYHSSVSAALLQAGANPNQADFDRITPLHTASGQGHVESMKLLLEHGAEKEARDRGGQTPLDWAIRAGQEDASRILMSGTVSMQTKQNSLATQVWKPRASYVPNWYDKRSGLDSSIVLAVTIGDRPKT